MARGNEYTCNSSYTEILSEVCHLTLGLQHTDDIVVGQRVEEEEIAPLETMVFSQRLRKEGGQ